MVKPITIRREFTVPVSPEALWPYVSNTNRLNKALGLPATIRGESVGEYSRTVTASLYGFIPLRWTERPFEWVEGRFYRSLRLFEGGPLERFDGLMELEPAPGGTKVTITSDFTPRGLLGSLIVGVTGRRSVNDTARIVGEIGANLARGEGDCFPDRRTKTAPDEGALAQRGAALRRDACDQAYVERLLKHVSSAHDDELAEMRPFELADRWALDRVKTLETMLHAVKAGLLDLTWHVLCPNCSGGSGMAQLSKIEGKAHCDTCDEVFGCDLAESVEVRFSISPAVRGVANALFCVGSPAHSRFACAQFSVPKEGRVVEVELSSKSYALRDLCKKRSISLRPSESGPSELSVAFDGGVAAFKPGRVRLNLPGSCASALVRLEREAWKEGAAKAALVTSLQDFRDLFASDVLAPGVEISVRNIALLFTDLKGSTALYEKIGDAPAYAIVRDHFDYLFEIVKRHKGAVVKTIGDAVMACFSSSADAVAAALEMQARVGELNARLSPRPPVVLKIGVHQGPAIAINAGGILDYFGTTANVAARVQNESVGGDVVVTQPVVDDPASEKAVDPGQWRCDPFDIQLKGLSETYRLRRITSLKR